ncbi:DUF2784 domain-containing protein [soil metagenome]
MNPSIPWLVLADAVLILHVGVVLFVVAGLALVLVGNLRSGPGWRWVNSLYFRLAHLGAIAYVAAQAWLGITCPLTTLEQWLRVSGGAPAYGGGFIEHWLSRLLFWNAPAWVFTLIYTLFAMLVVAIWWRYPPRRPGWLQ